MDVTDYQVLSLRVGVSHGDEDNLGGQDFTIVMEDLDGNSVSVQATDYSEALFYPPGRDFDDDGSRKTVLNGVDIPLTAFEGIDFNNVNTVSLVFDQTPAGSIQMTDLLLQRVER